MVNQILPMKWQLNLSVGGLSSQQQHKFNQFNDIYKVHQQMFQTQDYLEMKQTCQWLVPHNAFNYKHQANVGINGLNTIFSAMMLWGRVADRF